MKQRILTLLLAVLLLLILGACGKAEQEPDPPEGASQGAGPSSRPRLPRCRRMRRRPLTRPSQRCPTGRTKPSTGW